MQQHEQIDLFSLDLIQPTFPVEEYKKTKKRPTVIQLVKKAVSLLGRPAALQEIYEQIKKLCQEIKMDPPKNHSIRARIYLSPDLEQVAYGVHWFSTA